MPNYISKFVFNGVEYLLKAAASVTGVKGDNESDFRTGDVNLTKDNIGLGNVGNYKAVSTVASQGLSDTEKSNARANIGAGTSNFSGSYSDLTNKPTASDIGAIPASAKGANDGVAELDSSGKVPSSQLPSYVDDILEYADQSSFPLTGETGKIYIAKDTNKTYRWSGAGYVEISASLALGETSSTAYYGDKGKTAYNHASAKGSAFTSGLYKIATNSEGHVTGATAVAKSDITALGIPAQDTTYSSKAAASGGTDVSLVTTGEKYNWNSKTSNVGTITGVTMNGSSKGTSGVVDLGTVITSHQDISGKADKSATVSTVGWDSTNKKLTKTINGTTTDVVTGSTILGGLTKSQVTTALGYTPPTTDTNTTYTFATGDSNGQIKVTPSGGSAQAVSVKGLGSAAYTNSTAYAAASHNQASNTITAMTGYSKASSAAAIATTDSLNTALGKLEKTLDGKTSNTGTVTSVAAGTGLSGGTITTSGTISLASGVVTAGSAGPTAAVTGNDGATIAVPRITVDTYGRVTGLTSYNLTNKNTTYSAATQSAQGLMSAADKKKLDTLSSVPSGQYHLTFGKST